MTSRSLSLVCLIPLLLILAGCGSKRTASASITGKLTVNGQPVTGGRIIFNSDSGVYSGGIDPEGKYEVFELPPGEYTITVDNSYLDPDRKVPVYKGQTSGPGAMQSKMAGGGAMAAKYGATVGGAGGAPPSSYKGAGAEVAPPPEGTQTVKEGTFVKIPDIFTKKETSTAKVTVEPGDNKKDIDLTGK